MNHRFALTSLLICLSISIRAQPKHSTLIRGGTVVDGSGRARRKADVRISGDRIVAVGNLKPKSNELVIDATGKVVTPGFIDTHSHADGGIFEDRDAETQIRQGITTAVVGQDGGSHTPLKDWFAELRTKPASINFASFVGHGTVRSAILGENYKRPATAEESARMAAIVDTEMQAGALGLSSGLEYDPGFYSHTDEVIECAKAAA